MHSKIKSHTIQCTLNFILYFLHDLFIFCIIWHQQGNMVPLHTTCYWRINKQRILRFVVFKLYVQTVFNTNFHFDAERYGQKIIINQYFNMEVLGKHFKIKTKQINSKDFTVLMTTLQSSKSQHQIYAMRYKNFSMTVDLAR